LCTLEGSAYFSLMSERSSLLDSLSNSFIPLVTVSLKYAKSVAQLLSFYL
jgi:hypothetical protein